MPFNKLTMACCDVLQQNNICWTVSVFQVTLSYCIYYVSTNGMVAKIIRVHIYIVTYNGDLLYSMVIFVDIILILNIYNIVYDHCHIGLFSIHKQSVNGRCTVTFCSKSTAESFLKYTSVDVTNFTSFL